MERRIPTRTAADLQGEERGVPSGAVQAAVLYPYLKHGEETGPAGGRTPEARLAEAAGLVEAIDLEIGYQALVPLNEIRPGTYLGRGKIEELASLIGAAGIDVVVLDCALSPVQQRNLERALKAKVIDRTGLILEIFGERAHTKEGRLQVELAHLEYQKSRLVRSWTHLERQRGGYGFMGGPGERQIEADRRMIDERITKIKKDLEQVVRTRGLHRESRRRVPYPVIALVGYTNAGKSTLFNRLTEAAVKVEDQLFATLDPTMREVILPSGRRVILSDTVGFISDLPTQLIAAFRATLEEVREAQIILHVRDISHPDSQAQRADVLSVLEELDVNTEDGVPIVEVLNKIDRLDAGERETLANIADRHAQTVLVSARTGENCDGLLESIDKILQAEEEVLEVRLPHAEGRVLSWVYDHGEVLARTDDDTGVHLKVRMAPADAERLRHRPELSG